MNKLSIHLAADHPTGAGHFPGNPIIPGALLLAEVIRHIEQAQAQRFVSCSVKSAKFHHPARPGDRVDVEYSHSEQGVIDFQCAVAGTRVLSGIVKATINA